MMKKVLAMVAVLAMLLGLATVAMATGSDDPAKWDTSIFEIPDEFYFSAEADPEDTYSRCYCTDIGCLGVNHYDKGSIAYFRWWGNMETMPANVEENACCFTSAMTDQDTAVFWNGVPNLSKDLFKWWEGSVKDVFIPDSVTEIDENAFVENSTITLHFTANNAVALAYAQAHGMAYAIVPEAEEVSEPSEPSEPVSEPDVSEPVSEPESPEPAPYQVTMDASVFELPETFAGFIEAECMDSIALKLRHLQYQGVTFFMWIGGEGDTMPANKEEDETCFAIAPINMVYDDIVFWNGVPNLGKDLFTWWEGKAKNVYIPDTVTEIDEDAFMKGSAIRLHFTANNEVALAYAKARGMAFEVMGGKRMRGDVDFDKSVTMKDALVLRKAIASLPVAYELKSTDVNNDGTTDMKDVLSLRRKIAHLDVISHETYTETALGTPVTVETYIQDKQIRINGKASFYLQSEDGAYFAYAIPCTQEEYDALTPGTKVRISGIKSMWKDEVEITDATFEVLDGSFIAEAVDVTALFGTDKLIDHQNEKVTFKGLTVEAKTDPEGNAVAFLYNWNGLGGEGDDLYFDVTVNGKKLTFTVESDLCGAETDAYKAVKALQIGDVIDVTCYLYWYDGPNPHVFAVAPAA